MTLGKILHFIKPNCVMCILGITIILTTWTSLSSLMNKKDKGPANSVNIKVGIQTLYVRMIVI